MEAPEPEPVLVLMLAAEAVGLGPVVAPPSTVKPLVEVASSGSVKEAVVVNVSDLSMTTIVQSSKPLPNPQSPLTMPDEAVGNTKDSPVGPRIAVAAKILFGN